MALGFTLTPEGIAALRNPDGDGTRAVRVASVGLTATPFVPGQPVPSEIKRVSTLAGGATASDTIHVTVTDATPGAVYSVRGYGFYLDDGTLLGSYGQADVIVEKSAASTMQLAVDIQFKALDATQITFGDTTFHNPAATTDLLGVVELATSAEAKDGRDMQRAVTARGLRDTLDDRLGASAPTTFVKPLLALANAVQFREAIGPEFKAAPHQHPMADIIGLITTLAAKLDARSRYVPGQIVVSAALSAPAGTLLCNGAAISRGDYADLFAAIGTRFGAGDGSTTFNVPAFGEGAAIKATVDPQKAGTYSAGSLLSHTHSATAAGIANHSHTVTLVAAGRHAHGASASGVGDHAHGAWSDAQGYHGHTGGTTWNGDHQHAQDNNTLYPGYGDARVGYQGASQSWLRYGGGGNTAVAGGHSHSLSIDGNGSHGHNIGMNGAGAHTHTISIAEVGDHNHSASASDAGAHTHAITVAAAGDSANLAAGYHLFHFIAY